MRSANPRRETVEFDWNASATRRALLKAGGAAAGILLFARRGVASHHEGGDTTAQGECPVGEDDQELDEFWAELLEEFDKGTKKWFGGPVRGHEPEAMERAICTTKEIVRNNKSKWLGNADANKDARKETRKCCRKAGKKARQLADLRPNSPRISRQNYDDAVACVSAEMKSGRPEITGVAC
jgi:hypothetical protein